MALAARVRHAAVDPETVEAVAATPVLAPSVLEIAEVATTGASPTAFARPKVDEGASALATAVDAAVAVILAHVVQVPEGPANDGLVGPDPLTSMAHHLVRRRATVAARATRPATMETTLAFTTAMTAPYSRGGLKK